MFPHLQGVILSFPPQGEICHRANRRILTELEFCERHPCRSGLQGRGAGFSDSNGQCVCPVKGHAFTHHSETYQIHYSRWHERLSQQARYYLHCVSNPAEMQIEFDASQKTGQVLSHQ